MILTWRIAGDMAAWQIALHSGAGGMFWRWIPKMPDRWGPALRSAIWGAAPFIFFMAAVIEGIIAGNYVVTVVCAILFSQALPWSFTGTRLFRRVSVRDYISHCNICTTATLNCDRQLSAWLANRHTVGGMPRSISSIPGSPIGLQHLYQVAAGEVVNAGAKMHQLAGAKIHQRCWQ